jgi:4-amino-4-deoxy-L-arabinose transferase-like glycosyltransferase
MLNRARRISPLTWLVALLLVATFLRLAAWRDAPPGLRFDEMLVTLQAAEIQHGARPVYIDAIYEEPLYHYLTALAFSLFGTHLFTLRLVSLALSLLTIPVLYVLARRMLGQRPALLAAALYALSFWALMYSRLGLRLIAFPLLLLLGLYFVWRGLERQRRLDFVLAGIWLGLVTYTYAAMRLLPVWWIALLVCLFLFDRSRARRSSLGLIGTTAIALTLALPMMLHFTNNPAADRRLGEVIGPIDALLTGDLFPLINSIGLTAAMFFVQGDPETLYNIPNRPVFDLLTGVLFVVGVVFALKRWRDVKSAFLLAWLAVGLIPSVITWPAGSNNHTLMAQPVIFMLAGLGTDRVAARLPKIAPILIALLLGLTTTRSVIDYFSGWASLPAVRAEHQAGIAAVAAQIDRVSADRPAVFSSGAVTHWEPWSVTTFRLTAPIGYTATRWFDARSSFIFPQGQTDLTLINAALDDRSAPLDGRLIDDLFPIVEPLSGSAAYSATHLISSLNTRLVTLTQASISWPPEAQAATSAQLPVSFSDHLELSGYELRRTAIPLGRNIRLTTYWRAQQPLGSEPTSIFVHVLDQDGNLAAQWDGFTIAPEYVQAGDIIVQVHFIPIPPDFKAGEYQLALGRYYPNESNQPRLAIEIDGQPVADRIWLQPVRMVPP